MSAIALFVRGALAPVRLVLVVVPAAVADKPLKEGMTRHYIVIRAPPIVEAKCALMPVEGSVPSFRSAD